MRVVPLSPGISIPTFKALSGKIPGDIPRSVSWLPDWLKAGSIAASWLVCGTTLYRNCQVQNETVTNKLKTSCLKKQSAGVTGALDRVGD